jgi:large subunit ribosomal protein L4
VAGSTKKLFRQKGTGNARAGTKRTNKRRGGGTAKGPKPRDYSYALPRQALKAATRMAVLSKIRDNAAVVVDDFGLAAIKTKDMAGILKALKLREVPPPAPAAAPPADSAAKPAGKPKKKPGKKNLSLLIGTDKLDPVVYKSARNLEGVRVLPASDFNAYEVLRPRRLVLTRSALDALRTAGKA